MKNYWLDRIKERKQKEKQKEVPIFPSQLWNLIKQNKTRRKGKP